MERLSNKKFSASQIVSDVQSQAIFGGENKATIWHDGRRDTHGDTNNNSKWDKGEIVIIFGRIGAPPPLPGEEEETEEHSEGGLVIYA